MLVLMISPYAVARIMSAVLHREFDLQRAACIGLTILFVFTGIGHFIKTASMAAMLPPWVPMREIQVYLTGLLEFAMAAGFLVKKTRRMTGWISAFMLILFFPVNVYAAINHIPLGGHAWGPIYLLIRAPIQLIILFWIYWFSIKQPYHYFDSGSDIK